MVSTYHGIETGRAAIEYFRKGVEIAAQNTSNAKDANYSNRAVVAGAKDAYTGTDIKGYLGSGAEVVKIQRMRDQFLDQQYRSASLDQAYWSGIVSTAGRIEKWLSNPSQKNMDKRLNEFWKGLEDIHKKPGDTSVLSVMLERTDAVTSFAQQLRRTFTTHRDELNETLFMKVHEANTLIDQLAVLNGSIAKVRVSGGEINDLLDKRDSVADALIRLTGATVGLEKTDDLDGAYKIDLHGKILVQGTEVRHLVCVPNPGNDRYYDVQVEYNQYEVLSDPKVADVVVERRADDRRSIDGTCNIDGTHELDVKRTGNEKFWSVGYGKPLSQGGSRKDGILTQNQKLGISGSFSLQVGSSGVRDVSRAFVSNPPGLDVMLGAPGPGAETEYRFRISAGNFESTLTLKWDASASAWTCSDNLGNSATASGAGGAWSNQDMSAFINKYTGSGVTARVENHALVLESTDRHYLSVTDMKGDLMSQAVLTGGNPAVLIEVGEEDSLQTIANKINNAYRFDELSPSTQEGGVPTYTTNPPGKAPNTPESWLHATVEKDGKGEYYLCLTSNVAGEEARINVMSGSVCGADSGEMYVPRLLGLVEDDGTTGQTDVTSYIQIDRKNETIASRGGGDVFVRDAWFVFDGKEYLSPSNAFKEARRVAVSGKAPSDPAEFAAGIRLNLKEAGKATLIVRHPLLSGELLSLIKSRDDLILEQMDFFDDMMYRLGTEFNAVHYAGYGVGGYAQVSGMAFFNPISSKYGSFGSLQIDESLRKDPSRFAAACGDGKGKSRGAGDGNNALLMAQLEKRKLFAGQTSDFKTYYEGYIADLGAFTSRAYQMEKTQNHLVEQISLQRKSVMGVNTDEDLMNSVRWNQNFNAASQYVSKLLDVIDKIITGVGRVGL